jgi:hypothetical protein
MAVLSIQENQQGQKQLPCAPSSLILANHFFMLFRRVMCLSKIALIEVFG